MPIIRRRPLVLLSVFSVALVVAAAAGSAPRATEAAAAATVAIDLRVWQHVDNAEDIWISARLVGEPWNRRSTIPFPLDRRSTGYGVASHHRHGDLAIGGVGLRIWQRVSDSSLIYVEACASACPQRERGVPLPWRPLGMTPLPLDDGRSSAGHYRYGNLTVAIPRANPVLLADRVRLLALRDVMVGDGQELDWSVSTPTRNWEGITVRGTPPRVTELRLSGHGLRGEIWGWLGDLTELKKLHLDGNDLTGRIPSKVSLLTNLTHVSLDGNAFEDCIPPALRAVADHDLASLGLADCPDISSGEEILTVGTRGVQSWRQSYRFVFDVPPGTSLISESWGDWGTFDFGDRQADETIFEAAEYGAMLRLAEHASAWLFLDYDLRGELERSHYPACVYDCPEDASGSSWLERLAASVWVDTSVTRAPTYSYGDTPVYVDPPGNRPRGYYAPNIVHGEPIQVCTEAYPNAVADAVRVWNDGLRNHAPPFLAEDQSVFAAGHLCDDLPPIDNLDNRIDYVQIVSRHPWDSPDFFCDSRHAPDCTLFWAYSPHSFRYEGEARVIFNEERRPATHDAINDLSDPDYKRIVRTIAQALGHVLGLHSPDCGNMTADDAVESLMQCSALAIEAFPDTWAFPLQERDFEEYARIYRPRTVADRVSEGEVQPFAKWWPRLSGGGGVHFVFDYDNLVVDDKIEVRRWGVPAGAASGTEPRWLLLRSYDMERPGLGVWTRDAPSGLQRYGVFTTTHALLAGQCYDNDPDCDTSNNGEDWVPGEPIGFGRLVEVLVTR